MKVYVAHDFFLLEYPVHKIYLFLLKKEYMSTSKKCNKHNLFTVYAGYMICMSSMQVYIPNVIPFCVQIYHILRIS